MKVSINLIKPILLASFISVAACGGGSGDNDIPTDSDTQVSDSGSTTDSGTDVAADTPATIEIIPITTTAEYHALRPNYYYGTVSSTTNSLSVTKYDPVNPDAPEQYEITLQGTSNEYCPVGGSEGNLMAVDEQDQHYLVRCRSSVNPDDFGLYIVDQSGALLWQSGAMAQMGPGVVDFAGDKLYLFDRNRSYVADYMSGGNFDNFYTYRVESMFQNGRSDGSGDTFNGPSMKKVPNAGELSDGRIITTIKEYSVDGGTIQVCNGIEPCYSIASGMITDADIFYYVMNTDGTLALKIPHNSVKDWVNLEKGGNHSVSDTYIDANGVLNVSLRDRDGSGTSRLKVSGEEMELFEQTVKYGGTGSGTGSTTGQGSKYFWVSQATCEDNGGLWESLYSNCITSPNATDPNAICQAENAHVPSVSELTSDVAECGGVSNSTYQSCMQNLGFDPNNTNSTITWTSDRDGSDWVYFESTTGLFRTDTGGWPKLFYCISNL